MRILSGPMAEAAHQEHPIFQSEEFGPTRRQIMERAKAKFLTGGLAGVLSIGVGLYLRRPSVDPSGDRYLMISEAALMLGGGLSILTLVALGVVFSAHGRIPFPKKRAFLYRDRFTLLTEGSVTINIPWSSLTTAELEDDGLNLCFASNGEELEVLAPAQAFYDRKEYSEICQFIRQRLDEARQLKSLRAA